MHRILRDLSRRGVGDIPQRGSLAALVAPAALALAVAAPARASAPVGFSFHASNVTGISTGSAFLTGGGAFDPAGATAHAGGGFRCTNTIAQAPFAGCQAGQGVRWDTSEVLPSTMFKCTAAEVGTGRAGVQRGPAQPGDVRVGGGKVDGSGRSSPLGCSRFRRHRRSRRRR